MITYSKSYPGGMSSQSQWDGSHPAELPVEGWWGLSCSIDSCECTSDGEWRNV